MIKEILNKQDLFLKEGHLNDYKYRLKMIKQLEKMIRDNEKDIVKALYLDLGKNKYQSYVTELFLLYKEINYVKANLKKWIKPNKKKSPLFLQPANAYSIYEPYGKVLIISPWNYPVSLSLQPMIGALAAGNTITLKPSEISTNTQDLLSNLISKYFDSKIINVQVGDKDFTDKLLDNRFDMIFFTGSTKVGKIIMEKAAKHLTPVVLELGGKSPVIITKDANIDLACRKIIEGKLINAGQTCIAPDYLLVDQEIKDEVIDKLQHYHKLYLKKGLTDNNYSKIINKEHLLRLLNLLENQNLLNEVKVKNDRMDLCLVDNPSLNSDLMNEEIFGPILPIIPFADLKECIDIIKDKEKPLALYLFTNNKKTIDLITNNVSFGGGCINDVLMHFGNEYLPFGGVGYSGMGNYHGEYSFKAFSHEKSVLDRKIILNKSLGMMPASKIKLSLIRKFFE